MAIIATILSGGTGSRLWPISREAHPKPFMKLPDGQSFLQKTFTRATKLSGAAEILTITNRDYYFKTKDEYAALKPSDTLSVAFLLEPAVRNTAPAIALAAFRNAEVHGDDAIMLVMPADHLINQLDIFNEAVNKAERLAQQNYLVTFGIQPHMPETGYGYIECGKVIDVGSGFAVTRFVEKPNLSLAQQYLVSGCHLWNSGMFCFKVSTMLAQLQKHAPDIYRNAKQCWEQTKQKVNSTLPAAIEIDADCFTHLTDISIDYAVMEKADNVAVVAGKFDWCDVGSWDAVSQLASADGNGNRVIGEAMLFDANNCYIQSENRMIAAIGIENLIVVDTADALLVANRERSQDVKKVVEQLKLAEHETYRVHKTVNRPWGSYTVLEEGAGFKIKRIVVSPGASLSLQMHYHRSEHWVVVSGIAKVVNGDNTYIVKPNESTYIPAGNRHRLENPGAVELVLIEVQNGEYLGEDDIVRFEDKYGRASEAQ